MNTWKRKVLALLSVPLLAVPSAAGVYLWLFPHIGEAPAGMTAAGFEALYIGINVLIINSPELRRYARNVALAGVVTAVVFNTLSRYQTMVGGNLRAAPFDGLSLFLAILESIPLAGLAYAVSVLLHRLSEERATPRTYRARLARRLWQLRSMARSGAQARAEIASLSAMLAQTRADLAQAAVTIAHLEKDAAQPDPELAQLRAEITRQETTIAQLRAELAQPIVIDGIDVCSIARRLRDKGISQHDQARIIGMPESTLRSRLKATNGAHAE